MVRDRRNLGLIPTPRDVISVAFSGPDPKTLYAVSRDNALNKDWIIAIEMIAQGPKGHGRWGRQLNRPENWLAFCCVAPSITHFVSFEVLSIDTF